MTFAYSAGVITQTGIDADLSGLNGLTGVTRTFLGGVTNGTTTGRKTIYTLASVRLVYDGMTIDPRKEMIIFEDSCSEPAMQPTDTGADLTIGVVETYNGEDYGTNDVALWFSRNTGKTFDTCKGLYIPFGVFNWYAGSIRTSTGFGLCDNSLSRADRTGSDATGYIGKWATLEVFGWQDFYSEPVEIQQFFNIDADFEVDQLRVIGHINAGTTSADDRPSAVIDVYAATPPGTPAPSFNLINCGITYSGNTADIDEALLELRNITGTAMTKGANLWQYGVIRVINSDLGSALPVLEHNITPTHGAGFVELRQEVDISLTDESDLAIDAKYYMIDTDNGDQRNYTRPAPSLSFEYFEQLNTYSGATTSGTASITTDGGVIVFAVCKDTASYVGIDDSGANKKDRRGDDDTTADLFTFKFCSYAQGLGQKQQSLKALGAVQLGHVLITDAFITQQTKATVDAYTTIDDAFELYDRAKSYLYDNFAGEVDLIVTRSGSITELADQDLVINATAGSAFTYSDPTITVKSSTYTGGATSTTGDVTLQNGVLLNGGTFTCNINIDDNSDTDTYTSLTATKIIHTGTGTVSITLDASDVTEIEVTGGATLTVNLTNGSVAPTATETSGTITMVQNVNITNVNLIDDTRVQLYNVTKASELDNSVVSGGAGYSFAVDLLGASVDVGDTIRIRTAYVVGLLCKANIENSAVITETGLAFIDTQVDCTIYISNNIDGSTVTEYAADYPNVEVDINDPDGTTSVQRLYAWYRYNETTSSGISDFFNGFIADDASNYKVVTSIVSLLLDNVSGSPLIIVGARIFRDDNATIIATLSDSIHIDPDKAYIADSTGLATKADVYPLY